MTFSLDGNDIGQIVEIAAIVGSIVAAVIVSLIVYLMVRPPRHLRGRGKPRDADPAEAEELWRIVDLMERRLEGLERVLADRLERPHVRADEEPRIFAPAEDGRDSGRKE
jgi:hypothetical protein